MRQFLLPFVIVAIGNADMETAILRYLDACHSSENTKHHCDIWQLPHPGGEFDGVSVYGIGKHSSQGLTSVRPTLIGGDVSRQGIVVIPQIAILMPDNAASAPPIVAKPPGTIVAGENVTISETAKVSTGLASGVQAGLLVHHQPILPASYSIQSRQISLACHECSVGFAYLPVTMAKSACTKSGASQLLQACHERAEYNGQPNNFRGYRRWTIN
jgi:hypothetical protein